MTEINNLFYLCFIYFDSGKVYLDTRSIPFFRIRFS